VHKQDPLSGTLTTEPIKGGKYGTGQAVEEIRHQHQGIEKARGPEQS
jgi:hypothetical protein